MGYASEVGNMVELSGKIMVLIIIVLFLVVIFVFFHHLYAKWFLYCSQEDTVDTAPDHQELDAVTTLHKGLEPSVLKSMPVVVFSQKEFKDGLECVVCLCEVSEGEKARLLPKCNHGFHVDCIDMWFQSHSTCPLCRNPVSTQSSLKSSSPEPTLGTMFSVPAEENSPNFPTNVLFWGNQTQISTLGPLEEVNQCPQSQQPCSSSSSSTASSSTSNSNRPEGMLVIDIPREIIDEEESKLPMPMQLRLFKRLLNRDRRVSPCNPRDFDIEQGVRAQS